MIKRFLVFAVIFLAVHALVFAGEEKEPAPAAAKSVEIAKLKKDLLDVSVKERTRCSLLSYKLLDMRTDEADKAVIEVLAARGGEPDVVIAIIESIGSAKRYGRFQDEITGTYFKHKDEGVRARAIETARELASGPEDKAGNFLASLKEKAADESQFELVRTGAVRTLAGIEKKEVLSALVKLIGDRKKSIGREALAAVREISGFRDLQPEEVDAWWKENKDKGLNEIRRTASKLLYPRLLDAEAKLALEKIRNLKLLKKHEPENYTKAIIAELEKPENRKYTELRVYAASEAARPGKTEFIKGLLLTLTDENAGVKEAAVSALGKIGVAAFNNASIIDVLLSEYESAGPSWKLKGEIVIALGMIGGASPEAVPRVLDVLRKKLTNETDPKVKTRVIDAFGEVHSPSAVESLMKFLCTEGENPEVRKLAEDIRDAAARTFGALHFTSADKAEKNTAVRGLVLLLSDEHATVRGSAAESLGKIKARSAVPALISRLETDPKTGVRGWIMVALGKIGDKSAVDPILKAWNKYNDLEDEYALPALRDLVEAQGLVFAKTIAEKMAKDAALKKKIDRFLSRKFLEKLFPGTVEKLTPEAKTTYYQVRLILAESYFSQEKWNEARAAYQVVDDFRKTNYEIKKKLAECHYNLKDYGAAYRMYGRLLAKPGATEEDKIVCWNSRISCIEKLAESSMDTALQYIGEALKQADLPNNTKKKLEDLKAKLGAKPAEPGKAGKDSGNKESR